MNEYMDAIVDAIAEMERLRAEIARLTAELAHLGELAKDDHARLTAENEALRAVVAEARGALEKITIPGGLTRAWFTADAALARIDALESDRGYVDAAAAGEINRAMLAEAKAENEALRAVIEEARRELLDAATALDSCGKPKTAAYPRAAAHALTAALSARQGEGET